jgi:hypothetical protein
MAENIVDDLLWEKNTAEWLAEIFIAGTFFKDNFEYIFSIIIC